MKLVSCICSIGHAQIDLRRALELLTGHADLKQWVSAGVELGRIEELSNRIAATCRLASEALREESRG